MKTDEQAAAELEARLEGDPEGDHIEADEFLCELLTELGYPKTVEKFNSFGKWYA